LNSFDLRVYQLVIQIPKGKVSTYKDIAKALGDERKSRRVGKALAKNPNPIIIPCHRVIKSDGSLGGYSLGVEIKEELLRKEGIIINKGKIDLSKYIFKSFK